MEKTRLFGKVFVSGFVVFYLMRIWQLLEPRCSETEFAKKRLASAGFWDVKNFFSQLNFVWIYHIYLDPLLSSHDCFLPVSPDFATCSMALLKHLVNVVMKRLSTLASLALITLAPMFLFSLSSCSSLLVF